MGSSRLAMVNALRELQSAGGEEFGDDVVTAFDRADDVSLQEVIDYLIRGGYVQ